MKKCLIFTLLLFGIFMPQDAGVSGEKEEIITDKIFNFQMVRIPAGIVRMPKSIDSHAMDIHIDSFYIGKYEVTQKLWKAVMGAYPVPFDFKDYPLDTGREDPKSMPRIKEIGTPTGFIGENLPVETISWEQVQVFLKKLSKLTGHHYRLPTHAEWLHAYRAGTDTRYYFGDDKSKLDAYEWYDKNSGRKTHSVGQKKPNPWGLYDMGGNVGEWCSDLSDMEPYRRKYPDRKWSKGLRRVYKGSHYLHRDVAATAFWTHSYKQVYPHYCVGFRLVREIPKSEQKNK